MLPVPRGPESSAGCERGNAMAMDQTQRQRFGGVTRLQRALFIAALLTAPLAGAGPDPRVLLLQQSSAGDHQMTLFALEEAGYDVTWCNKDSIDAVPQTGDEFARRFDVVFFGSLALEGGLAKLLTAEQLGALVQFVADGGGLVTVIGEAGKTLAELLPIESGASAGPMVFRPTVKQPEHPALGGLPERWPLFGSKWNSFNKVAAKPGADVLLEVPAQYVGETYPLLVAGRYGKGRVLCLNSLWAFSTGLNFKRWEWAPACFAQWGRWAAGLDVIPSAELKPIPDPLWFWRYERERMLDSVARLDSPVLTPIEPPPEETAEVRFDQQSVTRELPAVEAPGIEETDAMLSVSFGNGMLARIDKRGMVGYRTVAGLELARDPVAERPHILYSGDAEAVITNADGGEFAVLKETLPEPKAGAQALRYSRHEVVGAGLLAVFDVMVNGEAEGQLAWRFEPRTLVVDGVEWKGVGEALVLTSPRLFVEQIIPQHRWALGGSTEGHYTFRSGCYSRPRGYGITRFDDTTTQDAGHFRWFSSGQPFQMLGSPAGTLWCFTERPAMIASWLSNQAGSGFIRMTNRMSVGRRRGTIETPTLWYLFSPTPMDHNLWMSAYDHVRGVYRRQFGVKPMQPRPTAMARFHTLGFVDLRRYADVLIPFLARLGFKRFDCGVSYVHDVMDSGNGGTEALRYLCDQAHAAGLEVIFYCGSAWAKTNFEPMKQNPDWIIRGRDGKPKPTGYPDLYALSLRSGWWDYSLSQYAELRKLTGMDGVWVDSWTMPNEYVNLAEPQAEPTVTKALQYVKALQELGYTTLIEGQSPVGLDSFWYRQDRYGDLKGNEFILYNTSPFAYAGNGLFHLDLFRLLSYNCAMLQDPRLLHDEADRMTQVASHYNHLMNELHATVGFPHRVRETAFGTRWESEHGYAIFAHRSTKLSVVLPGGQYTLNAVDNGEATMTLASAADGSLRATGTLMARGVLMLQRK